MLRIKRVYEPAQAADGYRVLVDRLWPRGLSKASAHVDLWLKEIGPSDALRRWFGHAPARWADFSQRYRRELRANPEPLRQIKAILKQKGTVTLVYGARDEAHNQAVVLLASLKGKQ